jgi:hypothetical protein
MTTPHDAPRKPSPDDTDLARQARPGYGIPSQDPRPGAQSPLAGAEAEREARSVFAGGGVVAGAITGSAIGLLAAGPAGALIGGALGGIAGAVGGAAMGGMAKPA